MVLLSDKSNTIHTRANMRADGGANLHPTADIDASSGSCSFQCIAIFFTFAVKHPNPKSFVYLKLLYLLDDGTDRPLNTNGLGERFHFAIAADGDDGLDVGDGTNSCGGFAESAAFLQILGPAPGSVQNRLGHRKKRRNRRAFFTVSYKLFAGTRAHNKPYGIYDY